MEVKRKPLKDPADLVRRFEEGWVKAPKDQVVVEDKLVYICVKDAQVKGLMGVFITSEELVFLPVIILTENGTLRACTTLFYHPTELLDCSTLDIFVEEGGGNPMEVAQEGLERLLELFREEPDLCWENLNYEFDREKHELPIEPSWMQR
jgi:hypothetical protein